MIPGAVVVFVGYIVAGFVVMWLKAIYNMRKQMRKARPRSSEWSSAFIRQEIRGEIDDPVSGILMIFWPVYVLGCAIYWVVKGIRVSVWWLTFKVFFKEAR